MEKLSRFSVLPVPHTVPLKTPSPSPRCRLLCVLSTYDRPYGGTLYYANKDVLFKHTHTSEPTLRLIPLAARRMRIPGQMCGVGLVAPGAIFARRERLLPRGVRVLC